MLRILHLIPSLVLFIAAFSFIGVGIAVDNNPGVDVMRVEGNIVPVVANYIERGIEHAESHQATACIIQLSTPGGLYNTTQLIVGRIMNAEVPIIVYVSPSGGWAGSAGTFITLAGHVAAMAPGS